MKFQCQESCGGGCCKIPQGHEMFIFLTGPDRFKLASFLKKPINKFAKQSHFSQTRFGRTGNHWHLKIKGTQCPFLSKAGRCTVYEARPTQCKTWPFWPENMKPETEEYFKKMCPGIGIGPELSEAEINSQLDEQRKADGIYSNQKR